MYIVVEDVPDDWGIRAVEREQQAAGKRKKEGKSPQQAAQQHYVFGHTIRGGAPRHHSKATRNIL